MKGQKGSFPVTVFPDDHNLVVLGHELGNVLNGLFGMAELLGDTGLSTEQHRWLRAIENSGRQMQSLIRSGGLSSAGIGSIAEPVKVCIDGIEMLEQVVISHTPQARSGKNLLQLLIDPGLPRYWNCDPCLVQQLLDNLVGNALKFTQAGEVAVKVTSIPGKGTPGAMLRLQVVDSGPGLGHLSGKRIYKAYQREQRSKTSWFGDRGLGLFICRNIVQAMNGQISCTAPEDGGTRFEIVLPETFEVGVARPAVFHSALLGQLHCEVKLNDSLRPSVENFLDRLGVSRSGETCRPSRQCLELEISDQHKVPANNCPPGLLFKARSLSYSAPHSRVLDAPLIQSSLEAVLLEMALEWKSLEFRSETRDSTPQLR